MKLRFLAAGIILSSVALVSNATLIGRAPVTFDGTDYRAYYDTAVNITWVTDANLFQHPGYAKELMNWYDAQAWLASLNNASYLGTSNWRLPSEDVNSDTVIIDCSSSTELNCRDNEMGYMFWQNGVSLFSEKPFTNLYSDSYWSGTDRAGILNSAWMSNFFGGGQSFGNKEGVHGRAWAVRDGDIGHVLTPLPEPGTIWLVAPGLAGLGMARRPTRNSRPLWSYEAYRLRHR
jgi:Protein of unknown function (DUF1566)